MNLIKILKQHNIEFRESGENVSKGYIGICCPFCNDDENYHMGINPKTRFWSCWKNSNHKGRGYYKLFKKLLNCSEEQLRFLCKDKKLLIEDEFLNIKNKLAPKNIVKNNCLSELKFLSEFMEIKDYGDTKRFWDYLIDRGFDKPLKLISKYNLKCCLIGNYKFRIIIPIYKNNELVTWTSRSIYKNAKLRYLSHPKEQSISNIKDTLFDYDYINEGGDVLFITEGPFDAMKLQYLFTLPNYKATCLYTKSIAPQQEVLLSGIAKKFRKVIIMLDRNEIGSTFELGKRLNYIPNLTLKSFPFNDIKDPGELTKKHIYPIEALSDI